MFKHNFIYSLKTLFKNKSLIFWTFAFPIILGTLFNMAFKDIEKNESFKTIDIAIINNKEFNENKMYKEIFDKLSDESNKEKIFNIQYVDEKSAQKMLENNEIKGYITYKDSFKITVKSSGIGETILKTVTEEIKQNETIIKNLTEIEIQNGNYNQELITKNIMNTLEQKKLNIEDISSNNLSYTMIEFYTLIAMTCLYGGILGMTSINQCLPNMSNTGKRISISPTKKLKMILSRLSACYLTQLIGLFILFIYTIFVLKIDYGNNLSHIILLTLIGAFAGLSLGIFISTVFKTNENTKTGIIISLTMLGCFLSGMMGITMKYIIDKNIPILNKINPVSMITDGFYSLYYYDTLNRYYINIVSLLIFSVILTSLSVISLRRQKYDSI